jgi:hypothetical protein
VRATFFSGTQVGNIFFNGIHVKVSKRRREMWWRQEKKEERRAIGVGLVRTNEIGRGVDMEGEQLRFRLIFR